MMSIESLYVPATAAGVFGSVELFALTAAFALVPPPPPDDELAPDTFAPTLVTPPTIED